jgi:acetyl esterase
VTVGCVIFSLDYRLAPEYPFPAAVDDGIAALKWVRTKGVELYNVDINRIAVGGVSA